MAGQMTSPGFIPSEKLSEVVLRHLARDIVEGRLPPGQRLHESQLASELGVSRSPVREAIHRLATEGLVEIVPRRGAFVTTLTAKSIQDTFEVRAHLERLAARLAAARTTPAALARMRLLNSDCAAAVSDRDVTAFFSANDALHAAIADTAGNPYLAKLAQSAAQRTFRPLFLWSKDATYLTDSVADHDEILRAIADGDEDAADRLMAQHLIDARSTALDIFESVAADALTTATRR